MYIGLHVKYQLFLSDFNETWIFSTDFRKMQKYQISRKSVQWKPSYSMWTDRQTDMTKLKVAFCNFAKAPKDQGSPVDKSTVLPSGEPFATVLRLATYQFLVLPSSVVNRWKHEGCPGPPVQCYFARSDIWNDRKSFNPSLDKAELTERNYRVLVIRDRLKW